MNDKKRKETGGRKQKEYYDEYEVPQGMLMPLI